MTPTQQARVEGFLTALDERGVDLTLSRTGQGLRALVQPDSPESQEFRHGDPEAVGDRIHVLRSDVPTGVSVGDVFEDSERGVTYRVVDVDNRPSKVVVEFRCETAEVEA